VIIMPVRPAMVISWMLCEKSCAWRMAVSRLTWVVQTMAPAQIMARTTQIAAVSRIQIFKSAMRGIVVLPCDARGMSGRQIDLRDCASCAAFRQNYSRIANFSRAEAVCSIPGGRGAPGGDFRGGHR